MFDPLGEPIKGLVLPLMLVSAGFILHDGDYHAIAA